MSQQKAKPKYWKIRRTCWHCQYRCADGGELTDQSEWICPKCSVRNENPLANAGLLYCSDGICTDFTYTGYKVIDNCTNCGFKPSIAGETTSYSEWVCPKCYVTNSNPYYRNGIRSFDSMFTVSVKPTIRTRTNFDVSTSKDMPNQWSQSSETPATKTERASIPNPLAWLIVFLVFGGGLILFNLITSYGLARVAFTSAAALVIFAMTTIALSNFFETVRLKWLAEKLAPIAAAMFAVMFWSLLIDDPLVDKLIRQLMDSYLGLIAGFITILAAFLSAWLFWRHIRSLFGR